MSNEQWVRSILERLEEKVDKLNEHQQEHAAEMKLYADKTAQNEEQLEQLSDRLTPIEHHVLRVQGVIGFFKWIGAAGTLAAVVGAARWFGVV